jgi:hypothetical protein
MGKLSKQSRSLTIIRALYTYLTFEDGYSLKQLMYCTISKSNKILNEEKNSFHLETLDAANNGYSPSDRR